MKTPRYSDIPQKKLLELKELYLGEWIGVKVCAKKLGLYWRDCYQYLKDNDYLRAEGEHVKKPQACLYCGKVNLVPLSDAKLGHGWFCSREHYFKFGHKGFKQFWIAEGLNH